MNTTKSRSAGLVRATAAGTALALLVGACARPHPDFPVAGQGVPITALNASMAGTAPPVAARITAERIQAARTEPHNWLTYYGAYDRSEERRVGKEGRTPGAT